MTTLDDFQDIVGIIAPTPYHLASLTDDITKAIDAFEQNVPFPTFIDHPYILSPIDLAMLHPTNYRLLTLYAMHGHKPLLSETNKKRKRRLQYKQRQLQIFIMLQHLLRRHTTPNNSINSADVDELFNNPSPKLNNVESVINESQIPSLDAAQIPDDHECCMTFSDYEDESEDDTDDSGSGDDVIDIEQYNAFVHAYTTKLNAIEPEIVELDSLSLPNRSLLLTATILGDIYSNNDEYFVQLLSKAIILRCMRLLQDVCDGTLNCDDVDTVQAEINDIYNIQNKLASNYPFIEWEKALDLGNVAKILPVSIPTEEKVAEKEEKEEEAC